MRGLFVPIILRKGVNRMGAVDERMDARAAGDYRRAFELDLVILNRKGSKRLMQLEIEECLNDLEALELLHLLPENFDQFSVYGQRDILNKVTLP